MASIFEPPPPEPDRVQKAWDAIQLALGAWGLYALLVQLIERKRR
jgi:hypothetical protein